MHATTVVFHLSADTVASCVLSSVTGRTIGRVTPQRPLHVVLPPGTHVLRVVWPRGGDDLDVHVTNVDRQEVHLTVVDGAITAVHPPRAHANDNCSHCTS